MRSTAGTDITILNLYNSNFSLQFFLAAIRDFFQLFCTRKIRSYFSVLCHHLICFVFNTSQFFWSKRTIIIHSHFFFSQMKTYIFITKSSMYNSGNNMFSGMLLHLGKSLLKIQFAYDCLSRQNFLIYKMNNFSISFLHIKYLYFPVFYMQHTGICTLSPSFWKKGSSIKNRLKMISIWNTGQNHSFKIFYITVLII